MAKTKVGVVYRSTRRNWVKLWTHEWLRGTSRFELNPAQRSAFIDLLAMAGDSKVPGKVCAGTDGDGAILGFPVSYIAGQLTITEAELDEALKLFLAQGRITLESDKRGNPIVVLTAWEKYQSEYHRQKSYRSNSAEVTTKVTTETTPKLPVEGEGEVEVDKRKKNTLPARAFSTPNFDDFWNAYPVKLGRDSSFREWTRTGSETQGTAILAGLELWNKSERWQEESGRFIPHPEKFLRDKRWENPPKPPIKKESLDEQRKRLEKKLGVR